MKGDITVRRAESTDLPALVNLFHNARKSSMVIPADDLQHRSSEELVAHHLDLGFLNVCATMTREDGREEIVTFLSFDFTPNSSTSKSNNSTVSTYLGDIEQPPGGMSAWNTIFLVRFVSAVKECRLGSILRTVFLTLPMVDFILLVQGKEVLSVDELAMKFVGIGQAGSWVFCCDRQQCVKSLQCRTAKVEDYDDLVSVFDEQSEVIARRYGEFFLAEVIEGQTEKRKALVAVVDNKAVGLMCVTAEIDVQFLNAHFDLQEFGYLKRQEEPQSGAGQGKDEGNCFAIGLFGIDRRHASRAFEMMKTAFELFPDKEYCTLSLPHDTQETALTPYFSYARPLALESKHNGKQANFSHALYLFHRDAIRVFDSGYMLEDGPEKPWWVGGSQLEVGECKDLEGLAVEMKEIMGKTCDWLGKDPKLVVFAVRVLGTLVGVVAVERNLEDGTKWSVELQEGFEFDRKVPEEGYGVLRHIILNPIFGKSARRVFQFIMHEFTMRCLFYKLYSCEALPCTVSEEFAQVRPRSRFHEARRNDNENVQAADDEYALFALWKSDLSLPSYRVSTRIVVVGASDAGLALLQELLLVRHICFKNLMLVTPGSVEAKGEDLRHLLSAGSCNGPMSRTNLSRTGIVSQVHWASAKMVGLSKGDNILYLSGESELRFDKLVLATGKSSVELPECFDHPSAMHNLFCLESDPVHASELHTALKKSASLEPVEPVVVYGCAFEALSAIAFMLEMGKPGEAITLVLHKSLEALGFDDTTCKVISSGLTTAGVQVLKASKITDTHVIDGDIHSITVDDRTELSCSLLLLAAERGVDESVCRAVNEGGAVYDAGVVVDENLETVRSGIYAIGPAARFSRKCADAGRGLEDFDSVCIGTCAAKALLRRLDPLQKAGVLYGSTQNDLHKAGNEDEYLGVAQELGTCRSKVLCRGIVLPGELQYFCACVPLKTCRNAGKGSLRRRELRSYEKGRYVKLTINAFGFVERVSALIPRSAVFHSSCLEALVGMHVSYLNDVEGKLDRGDIKDLLHYFTEDWVAAMRHDEFSSMTDSIHLSLKQTPDRLLEQAVQALKKAYQSEDSTLELRLTIADVLGVGGESLNAPDAREAIETELAKFLRQHRSVLRMYNIERC